MTRRAAVVDFPQPIQADPNLQTALDRIRETLGRVTSIVTVPLLIAPAGVTITAASAGSTLAGTATALDIEDARLDSFRVVAQGETAVQPATVAVRDVTPGGPVFTLATLELPLSSGVVIGDWIQMATRRPAGARWIEATVFGNDTADQTLVRIELQARTVRDI